MKSEVMRQKRVSIMAALSMRNSTRCSLWVSVLLLLIFQKMLASLVLCAGVFILSNEVFISPFLVCQTRQHGDPSRDEWCGSHPSGTDTEAENTILTTLVILALYIPLVLVAFALLSLLLAAYAKDRGALWFSVTFQAASSLLTLAGIIGFLLRRQSYFSWKDMTLWFYICVDVQVELVITTGLTCAIGRRLSSEWQ